MLDDAFFNVEAWIDSELANRIPAWEQEETAFTTGDGTQEAKSGSRRMNPRMKPIRFVCLANSSTYRIR